MPVMTSASLGFGQATKIGPFSLIGSKGMPLFFFVFGLPPGGWAASWDGLAARLGVRGTDGVEVAGGVDEEDGADGTDGVDGVGASAATSGAGRTTACSALRKGFGISTGRASAAAGGPAVDSTAA